MQAVKYIKELLAKNIEDFSSMQSLFLNIRILIEKRNLKEKYKTLNFYCNWVAHSKIDTNPFLYPFLREISINLHYTNKDYVNSVVKALKTDILKQELFLLLKDFDILFMQGININSWYKFLFLLFEILIDKPINYKDLNNLPKARNREIEEIKKQTKIIGEHIDKHEKYTNPQLSPKVNYQRTFLITEFKIVKVFNKVMNCKLNALWDDDETMEMNFEIYFRF